MAVLSLPRLAGSLLVSGLVSGLAAGLAAGGSSVAVEIDSVDGDIVVFAAASLTKAFTAIGEAFESDHPDVDVVFNFAASSGLVTQISEGAPADVFASADQDTMRRVVSAELTDGDAARHPPTFATNSLAILVEPGNPEGIEDLDDLADRDLVLVTCDPDVPIGRYSQDVFDAAGIDVEPDSYEENVRGIVTKVVEGEADAGVVYVTDVIAAGDDAEGVEIPADVNVVAEYPITVVAEAPNPDGAEAFTAYVLGARGQAILADHGFGPIDQERTTDETSEG